MPMRSKSTSWWGGLACGVALVISPATVLLLGVLLAPALLVRVVDGPDKLCVRAVIMCNVAASITPLCALWRSMSPEIGAAVAILSGPAVVPTAWLAAGAAWMTSELLVLATCRWLGLRDRHQATRLQSEIDRLSKEWGTPAEVEAQR